MTETLTDEQAEAMLKRLTKHYDQPVMPINRYCDGLRTWADVLQEAALPGRNDNPREYVAMLPRILLDIRKSNLLARILYGGERLRTLPCPEHQGHWSGITECRYGCGSTGWIPNTENRPSKEAIQAAIEYHTDAIARGKKAWGEKWSPAFHERDIVLYRGMLDYLYSDGEAGINAPFTPKHVVFVCVTQDKPHQGTTGAQIQIRIDFDPRLRTGEDAGRVIAPVPVDTIKAVLEFRTTLVERILSVVPRELIPLLQKPDALERFVQLAGRSGRSGLVVEYIPLHTSNIESLKAAVETAVKEAGQPVQDCEIRFVTRVEK